MPGDHRVNERIRVETVRLIDNEGNQRGVMATREALALARSLDLDLVEIAPTAQPPVARIMDYGKFKFDEAQRQKESRRKGSSTGIKEMKYGRRSAKVTSTQRPARSPSSSPMDTK